jgi:hypothetical protein
MVEEEPTAKLGWVPSVEIMLAKWCDQAKSFEWMHTESYATYAKKAKVVMITSNVLTAVSGLSNVIAGGTIINGFQLAWIFGSLSIIVSIANMLQEKLAYTAKATEHQQYSVQWGTIRRKIEEELSIPPDSFYTPGFQKRLCNFLEISETGYQPGICRGKCQDSRIYSR